jgi:hypothetical protein
MDNASFIKLYKNDFDSAKLADDTPIVKLPYRGFIAQKPSETFLQISAGTTPITFVGGIQVDLIDCAGNVKQNIDNNFYYIGFVDSSGVEQIAFEFGLIGADYWSEVLYLKITDLVNDNVWYSIGFLLTDYRTEISTRFDYTNKGKLFNISYDLAPYIQSIRLADCYDQSPANKSQNKQYITALGYEISFRKITTFLRKYVLNALDYFVNDRLEVLFSHQFIYVNRERATISEYKPDERQGDTNFLSAEFLVNPQGEKLPVTYQIYEYLDLISKTPFGLYALSGLPTSIIGLFNKPITLSTGTVRLYKGSSLFQTFNVADIAVTGNQFEIDITGLITDNDDYFILIDNGLFFTGAEVFPGISLPTIWTFSVSDADYNSSDYNNSDYFTN